MKAYAQVVVFGVILCFLQESSCDYRTNNEIDSNSREINKMNRKLDILTNEVRKLKEESPNEGDIFAEHPFPVNLLSARREVTEEGVVYTVRYATDRRVREKVVWEVDDDDDDFSREIISNSIPVYNRGFQETKFLTRNGTHSYVSLYISTETSWLSITLENNGQGNLTTRIETPKMIVEPTSRDLSYEVGENATFTVTTARNEDVNWRGPPGGMPGRRSYITARLVDLDTLTLIPYEISDGMYEKVEERQYFDYVEQVYAINTADYNVSGVVIVFADSMQRDELIAGVTVGRPLMLHPAPQSGPFPPGFMSFDDDRAPTDTENEGGDLVSLCSYHNPTCKLQCTVWGSNLSRIELMKIHPSGRTTPLDYWSYTVRETQYGFFKRVEAAVPSSQHTSHRYQCVAWDSLGQHISRNYTLQPFLKARILEDKSSLVRDGEMMANLTCTVIGDPITNITFDLGYTFKYLENQPPDEIMYAPDGTTVAVKQVVYDDGDEHGSSAESKGVLSLSSCTVTQNVLGRKEYPNTATYFYPSP